jgi:hypothetical protein
VEHPEEPEYHGNPINEEGALVIWDYGYNIRQILSYWADFDVVDVEVLRFSKLKHRCAWRIAEFADVVLCTKRWSESVLKHA